MDNTQIGKNVAQARSIAKMTQADIAEKMNDKGNESWRSTTTYKVEKGDRPLKATELCDLAEILGTTVNDLLRPVAMNDEQAILFAQTRELLSKHQAISASVADFLNFKAELKDPDDFTPAQIENLDYVYWEYRRWYQDLTPESANGKVQGFTTPKDVA